MNKFIIASLIFLFLSSLLVSFVLSQDGTKIEITIEKINGWPANDSDAAFYTPDSPSQTRESNYHTNRLQNPVVYKVKNIGTETVTIVSDEGSLIDANGNPVSHWIGTREVELAPGQTETFTSSFRTYGANPGTYKFTIETVLSDGSKESASIENVEVESSPFDVLLVELNGQRPDQSKILSNRFVLKDDNEAKIRVSNLDSVTRTIASNALKLMVSGGHGYTSNTEQITLETGETKEVSLSFTATGLSSVNDISYSLPIESGPDSSKWPDIYALVRDVPYGELPSEITITGKVINAYTQQPIANIGYEVSNCEKWFKTNEKTDSNGRFTAKVPLSSNYCGIITMGAPHVNIQLDVVDIELRSHTPGTITIDKGNRPDHCEEGTEINVDTETTSVDIGDVYAWPTARFYLYTTEDKSKNGYPLHVEIKEYDRCCPDPDEDPYECPETWKGSYASPSGTLLYASVAGEKFKVIFSELYKPGQLNELKSYEPFPTTDDFISKVMYVVRYDVQNDVIEYSVCNDGTCDPIENVQICPEDCGGPITTTTIIPGTTTTIPIPYGEILIDESHGESSTTDICDSGSCGFGQYEVKTFLEDAGFKVDVNKFDPLTYEMLSNYKMLILNGKYAGPVKSFTDEEITAIQSFVFRGGGLLVTCGGSELGTGDCWELYNPIISMFDRASFKSDSYLGGYDREAKFVKAHPISQGLDKFYIIHGVEVIPGLGQVIAESDKIPVLAAIEAKNGRIRIVIAGVGSGFMGQGLNSGNEEKIAANKKLLINIASWLTGQTIEKKENCPYECCVDDPEYLDKPCPAVRWCPPCEVTASGKVCPPCEQPKCVDHQCILQPSREYILKFKAGWNMYSLPVKKNYGEPVADETDCEFTSNLWHYSEGKYEIADFPYSGLGYWIKTESDCTMTVSGDPITIEDFPELNKGWNQIGAPSEAVNFYSVIGNCNLLSGPWQYNSDSKKYEKASVLRPGEGYWIKVKDECTLGSDIPPPPPEELSISKALRIG